MNLIGKIIYSIITFIAPLLLRIGSVFSKKLQSFSEGQKSISGKLNEIKFFRSQNPNAILVWFHCASMGEFEQGRPLIEAYKKAFPLHKILLTFFSPSGFDNCKNYEYADFVSYIPIDQKHKVEEFVRIVDAKICVIVKYEFWINLINAIHAHGTKLIGISVILRENQVMFKPYGKFILNSLQNIDKFFVQNQTTQNLLNTHGFNNITIAGDTRFDRVFENARQSKQIFEIEFLAKNHKTFVVGSAWQSDMDVIIPFINAHPEIKFVVAPHQIDYTKITAWANHINLVSIKYSDIVNVNDINEKNNLINTCQVIFVDTIGLLSTIYKYANYVFVGGGFDKGLHNILEAAVFGPPIFFGNKAYIKFEEATELIDLKVAFAIENTQNLETTFENIMNSPTEIQRIKSTSEHYIQNHIGATDKIMDYLKRKNLR